ncbi:SDR family oxidoreductase [Nonomuraea sp. NPDC046802]|uniref:SDR family NAD(P)-dependent oxidoreductase n=1 Tax=Nonomuraea sp. NPDC046802 TaxID=3154919 RepID=UPI0033E8E3AC
MRLAGTTALITGASGGIGRAIARALAARRVRVLLAGRDAAALSAPAEEVGGRIITADLGERDGVIEMMKQAGPVDIVVANAGVFAPALVTHHPLDVIDTCLDVNLRAPMVMARLAAEEMIAAGRGHIVFMSSVSGAVPTPRTALYNATKYGLRGFAHAIRADLAPYGVGVSVICPSVIRDAGMITRSPVRPPAWVPARVWSRSPEQVAQAVCRAVRHDIAEIMVAPWPVRFVAGLSGLSPALAVRLQRLVGADRIAHGLADGLVRRGTSTM